MRTPRRGPHGALATLIAVALTTTLATATGPAIGAATSSSDASSVAALDAAIQRLVGKDDGPPGIAVVVQRGDAPVLHAAGAGDVATGAPIAMDDHVRLASVAKAFSGAVVLALVADGVLDLDDTIGRWRPELPEAWSEVTVRDLLQHRSGVPDFSAAPTFQQAVVASLEVAPPPATLLTFVEDRALSFAPGTRYRYSNSDNVVLALIAESATGRPYAELLATEVAAPLGLTRTSLPSGVEVPTPFAHGYAVGDAELEDVTTAFAAGWAWASGGVVSTPGDANRFARGYARGATTDAATLAQQRRFVKGSSEPPGPGANSAGLGIFRYRTRCGTVYGHTGNTAGFTQFLAASADGTRSTVVSINAQITPKSDPKRFAELREIYALAVCAALA
jgi:D-alanyl-D-alanine carboxypeptidase